MSRLAIRCTMVSVVALRGDAGKQHVLLLQRAGPYLPGVWSYVAGHVDRQESGWQAARRELLEETGMVPQRLYATSFCEQFYAADDDCIEVVPAFVATVANDAAVRLNREHSAFRWLPFAAARGWLPFGSQRDLFSYLQREFIERPPCESLRIVDG